MADGSDGGCDRRLGYALNLIPLHMLIGVVFVLALWVLAVLAARSGVKLSFVVISNLNLILSGPGASGSRPMPDGRPQEPGGWNRIVLQVEDLPARIAGLKQKGANFKNELEAGPGGKQIQLEDPDGNPIELFEPARR